MRPGDGEWGGGTNSQNGNNNNNNNQNCNDNNSQQDNNNNYRNNQFQLCRRISAFTGSCPELKGHTITSKAAVPNGTQFDTWYKADTQMAGHFDKHPTNIKYAVEGELKRSGNP
mmetsp:Transcript_5772/g.8420  ORF Transcript_5772/g.8420 Transcript_5772/m.8420 type:complete len:114 (-) Transcript_5772:2236-2577(-)